MEKQDDILNVISELSVAYKGCRIIKLLNTLRKITAAATVMFVVYNVFLDVRSASL